MLEVEAYTIDQNSTNMDIIPGICERSWFAPHAYRCAPLKVANRAGWDLRLNEYVVVEWNGAPHLSDVEVIKGENVAESVFGMGTFTLTVGYIWKLSPGWQLMVMPIPNGDLGDCEAMTAIMEPEILNYPWFLTMRMFHQGLTRITPGQRVARVMPVRISEYEDSLFKIYSKETDEMKAERVSLSTDRELLIEEGVKKWGKHYHNASILKSKSSHTPDVESEASPWPRELHGRSWSSPAIPAEFQAVDDALPDIVDDDEQVITALKAIGVHVFPNYITDDECDELVDLFVSEPVDDLDASEWAGRYCEPVWPEHLAERMTINRMHLAEEIYGLKLAMDWPHLVRWRTGDWKDAHYDHGQKLEYKRRDYASTVFLDENYGGGYLTFPERDMGIRFDKGTMIIFEGGTMLHGVTRVTSGVRHTSPAWFVDKHKWWHEVEHHNPQGVEA